MTHADSTALVDAIEELLDAWAARERTASRDSEETFEATRDRLIETLEKVLP